MISFFPSDIQIISRTHDLAHAYDSVGKATLAEKCYVQARDMAQSGGCEPREVAFHIHALVDFYTRQGRNAEAGAALRSVPPPPTLQQQQQLLLQQGQRQKPGQQGKPVTSPDAKPQSEARTMALIHSLPRILHHCSLRA